MSKLKEKIPGHTGSSNNVNSVPILQHQNNYTLMKISGGSFENKANDVSLRSMIDAQLLGSKEKFQSEKLTYLNPQAQQSIFASLISTKLATSHASIFNNLNSKSSELMSNSRNFSQPTTNKSTNFSKFSAPIPTSNNFNSLANSDSIRNEFEKFKQLKKNSIKNYSKQLTMSNHLLSLQNKAQLQLSKNANYNLNRNIRQMSPSPASRLKDRKNLVYSSKTGALRTRKPPIPNGSGLSYNSVNNSGEEFEIKNGYRTTLNQSRLNEKEANLIEKLKVCDQPRPVTVKLFASSEFKMNLPPINKFKLFNQPGNQGDESRASNRSSLNKSATFNRTGTSRGRYSTARSRNNSKISSRKENQENFNTDNSKLSHDQMDDNEFDWPVNEIPYKIISDYYINKNQQVEGIDNNVNTENIDADNLVDTDLAQIAYNKKTLRIEYTKSDVFNDEDISDLDEDKDDLCDINDDENRGFSDDELDGLLKEKRSATSLSRKTSTSKISLSMDNSDSEASSMEYEDEEDIPEDPNENISEILQRYGFNPKKLLGVTIIKDENSDRYISHNPPLITSLFDNVPPTINFTTLDEKITDLPVSLKKLLKWKMCSITPNIVRSTISRSSFSLASQKSDWIGVWGSHMKPESFKCVKEYQKFNHLPGSFQIGRKDRLSRNLCHAQAVHGKAAYNFVPMTFVLPFDFNLLKTEFENKNCKWILKPPASARGQGIRLLNRLDQVPRKRPCVIQKYLANPHLIDDLKYDLRIYVYVTSYDPLRIYLFEDGLTRFASRKYSNSVKTINDKFMHLTNYSINKTNKDYKANDNENACYGHKWSLAALWTYLKKKGVNTDKIWSNMTDLIIKTIICGDPHVNVAVKTYVKRKYSVHELFGFDIILDENFKPWIVEVNISPSLNSSSPLDVSVKGQMIADLLKIGGYMIPDPKDMAKAEGKKTFKRLPKCLTFNKKIQPQQLSTDEKSKHQYYIQRHSDEKILSTIFDVMTPDDIRILVESEDEFNRRGNFTRIFPSQNSKQYLKYFDTTRYYNILLIEWINRFKTCPEKGNYKFAIAFEF